MNQHSDNETKGEEDGRQRDRQGLTGTLMALYKQVEESVPSPTHSSLCLSLHPAAPPLLSMTETDRVRPQRNSKERRVEMGEEVDESRQGRTLSQQESKD